MNNEFTGTWRGRRPSAGGLLAANNLSDLQNTENARENLGAASKDDLDVLKTQTDSELSALQAGKADIGEHLFGVGKLQGVSSVNSLPISLIATVECDDWSKFDESTISKRVCSFYNTYRVSNWTSPYIFCGIRFSLEKPTNNSYRLFVSIGYNDATPRGKRAEVYATIPSVDLINGKHTYTFVVKSDIVGSAFNKDHYYFAIDGIAYQAASSNTANPLESNTIDKENSTYAINNSANYVDAAACVLDVKFYDLKLFNFDITDLDAPYTIADFAAGKAVPLTLRKEAGIYSTDPDMGASTGAGWAINNPSGSSITTRGDWRCFSAVYYAYNRTADLPDGVSYAIDLSTKPKSSSTGDAYLANMGLGNLAGFSGKTVKGKLSFWYKKNNTDSSSYLGAMISKSVLGEITSAEVSDTDWHYFEADVETELTGTSGFYLGVYSYAASGTFTDYPWSIADFKFETYGEKLELADFRSGYQIKDLSGNGNHATIFGDVISRKNEDPTTMQVDYTWGSGVSTGAYVMGDTETLPANSEIEVLAKSSASGTLSLGTSSSASTTFANAESVGTTTASIAKFYTTSAAQKLFATPSVAGLTINLTLKITSLK